MFKRWLWRTRIYFRRHTVEAAVFLLIFVFLVIYFAKGMFFSIPAGSVGVLWERFGGGTVLNRTLGEGFHVIMPWNKIYIYNARVQLRDEKLDVLSVDGLELQVNLAYQFELIPASIPILHQFVGPDYATVMMDPTVAAVARNVFSANTPEEIYSERRAQIQSEIVTAVNQSLQTKFNPDPTHPVKFVRIEDVLTRSIKLPPSVSAAINSKNEQQQLTQEYDYRIMRESKEAERKRIEATGIRDFQDIISQGITENYLRWSAIQATLDLAKSNNAKIIIIGSGKDGLPVILGDQSGASSANTTVSASPPPPPLNTLPSSLGLSLPPGASTSNK